jgi:hypothetical protein
MPVSKRRKSSTKKRTPATVTPEPKSTRWTVKLNPSRLAFIKNNPDFLTLIKIGRALNAVSFGATGIMECNKLRSFVELRQYRRSYLILGGYLHESIKLVDSLKGRYLGDPDFEPLRLLVLDAEHKKARFYVKKVRNVAAFHLDEIDENTRRSLATVKPTTVNLACGDDPTLISTYWEFSDYLDGVFLVSELGDGRSAEATLTDLYETILNFSLKFMDAANQFTHALVKKLDLKEYLY